jgi:glutaminyl-peptide cyclotransferase
MPHPGRGFTQGLIADGDTIWESTGGYGESALSRYRLAGVASETDVARETIVRAALPAGLFGEGICLVGDGIWQLTWKERTALRWDAATLELRGKVRYNRDGWGMCAVGGAFRTGRGAEGEQGARTGVADIEVVTSDGTSELVRRDPETLEARAVVHVRCQGSRVRGLNDLAWDGVRVWANVAGTAYLAGIDLATGEVTDVADARAAAERHFADPQAIMNGIAALARPGEYLLTGKRWRAIRHVRLSADRDRGHLDGLLDGVSR